MNQKQIDKYINRKLCEGKFILFTGAGFSMSAQDKNGKPLPSGGELAKELWNLAFPDQNFDESSLPDVYEAARLAGEKALTSYLVDRFSVDGRSLPDWYKTFVNQPWYKCYTLNIDNLMSVAASKFNLDRKVLSLSKNDYSSNSAPRDLLVRHLNGTTKNLPNDVVFTSQQYGLQLSTQDPIYTMLTSELLKHPFIFVGSTLDEVVLWQHIALRRKKGSAYGIKETRPKSLLIIPKLSKAKQKILSDFNITWLQMTAKDFAHKHLEPNESATLKGFVNLKKMTSEKCQKPQSIPLVSELIVEGKNITTQNTEYLLGASPKWSDVISGTIAIEREKDSIWLADMQNSFKTKKTSFHIFTGTAGDGKTTFAMKIAAKLSAEGKVVGWLDEDNSVSPQKLVQLVQGTPDIEGLFIDTPDIYGSTLINPLVELYESNSLKFIALVIRSGRLEKFLSYPLVDRLNKSENQTYNLSNLEINRMLDLLRDTNLLGALKGKSRKEQFNIFNKVAQRQLIVAMIEATSGKDFKDKIFNEFETLDAESKEIYCIVAVASSIGHFLKTIEISSSINESSNTVANKILELTKRGLFQVNTKGGLKVRHKLIGETVAKRLSNDSQLVDYYTRLASIAAISLVAESDSDTRMKRLLKFTINHQQLLQIGDYEQAQGLYSHIESMQCNSHHFWLQRGSLELEKGKLSLARNYLNQAHALNENDSYVVLALANLMFKEANTNPKAPDSKRLMMKAFESLENLITDRVHADPYPTHVLGNEGLNWARKAIENINEKKEYLEKLQKYVKEGLNLHRKDKLLIKLNTDLQRELLELAIPSSKNTKRVGY